MALLIIFSFFETQRYGYTFNGHSHINVIQKPVSKVPTYISCASYQYSSHIHYTIQYKNIQYMTTVVCLKLESLCQHVCYAAVCITVCLYVFYPIVIKGLEPNPKVNT